MSSTTVTTTLCDGCRKEKQEDSKGWRHVRADNYICQDWDYCQDCWAKKPVGTGEQVEELTKAVALRDARITELEALYDLKGKTVEELHGIVDKLKSDLGTARQRAADLDAHGTAMSETAARCDRERDEAESESEADELRHNLKIKDEQLAHIRGLNDDLQKTIAELRSQLLHFEEADILGMRDEITDLLGILGKKSRARHNEFVTALERKYGVEE